MIEKLELVLVGVAPLLMHNIRLADPSSSQAIALRRASHERRRTAEQEEELHQIEWLGALYQDPEGRIAIPSENVLALVIEGARRRRHGKQAQAGVFETQAFYPLLYEGPKDPIKLYETGKFKDLRSARIRQQRVMRCRPRFDRWTLPISLQIHTELFNPKDALEALIVAGDSIGLGDYRPRYGRFTVRHKP